MFELTTVSLKTVYLWFSVGSTVATIAVFPVVKYRKKWERKCVSCGCTKVTRTHQLLKNPHVKNDNFHYLSFTFAECTKCGYFWLAKSDDKCFDRVELGYRERFKKHEFVLRPDLFRRAGIPLPDTKVEIHTTNILHSRIPALASH